MKKLYLLLVFIACAAILAQADYEPEPYSEALEEKARGGDAKAMYDIVYYAVNDTIVKINDEADEQRVLNYIKKSAEQNYPEALLLLGDYYCNGTLFNKQSGYAIIVNSAEGKDYDRGKELYKKAAMLNYPEGMNALGIAYLNYAFEENEESDYKNAFEWFQKSASLGNAEAFYYMACMSYNGLGMPEDVYKALDFFEKAATAGYVFAMLDLGDLYRYGAIRDWSEENEVDEVDEEPIPEAKISPDLDKAIKWYSMGAEKDNLYCTGSLINIFMNENSSRKDYTKAREWLTRLYEKGNDDAAYLLGKIYEKGLGVEKDLNKALCYYTDETGFIYDEHMAFRVGKAYFYGEDLVKGEKNLEKAFNHLSYSYNVFSNGYDHKYFGIKIIHEPLDFDSKKELYYMLSECYNKGFKVSEYKHKIILKELREMTSDKLDGYKRILSK